MSSRSSNPYDQLLSGEQIVALDLDCTLIDGPHSDILHDWVKRHPAVKKKIVTFRSTPEGLGEIHSDLLCAGYDPQWFDEVLSIPPQIASDTTSDAFREWKGKTAQSVGASVLVDDLVDCVALGCFIYAIGLVDSIALERVDVVSSLTRNAFGVSVCNR